MRRLLTILRGSGRLLSDFNRRLRVLLCGNCRRLLDRLKSRIARNKRMRFNLVHLLQIWCDRGLSDGANLLVVIHLSSSVFAVLLVETGLTTSREVLQRHVQLAVPFVRLESCEGVDHYVLRLWCRNDLLDFFFATRHLVAGVDLLQLLIRARNLLNAEELLEVWVQANLSQWMHDACFEVQAGHSRQLLSALHGIIVLHRHSDGISLSLRILVGQVEAGSVSIVFRIHLKYVGVAHVRLLMARSAALPAAACKTASVILARLVEAMTLGLAFLFLALLGALLFTQLLLHEAELTVLFELTALLQYDVIL